MSGLPCAGLRAALGEPLFGSAPTAPRGWLLLEHPGPWPSEATEAELPDEVAQVMSAARSFGVRPQLIRRPHDRRRRPSRVYLGHSGGEATWLRWADLDDLREVAALNLPAVARGDHGGFGVPSPGRILLVCTHGRHDACCARAGRPVAAALSRRHPEQVWETTHLGGHRFAATFLTLPEGTYHGALSEREATAVGGAALGGAVVTRHYRGRAGLSGAAQAAEYYVRVEYDLAGVADITHRGTEALDADTVRVALRGGTRDLAVTVRRDHGAEARRLSCGSEELERPDFYRLIAIASA